MKMLTLTNTWYIDVPLVLSNYDNIQIIFAKKRRRKGERYCVIEINCEITCCVKSISSIVSRLMPVAILLPMYQLDNELLNT